MGAGKNIIDNFFRQINTDFTLNLLLSTLSYDFCTLY